LNHDKGHEISKFSIKSINSKNKEYQRTVPSANAEMTFPSADKDLLIFLASSST
jgi:hypothetical protein